MSRLGVASLSIAGAIVGAGILVVWIWWPWSSTHRADPTDSTQVSLGQSVYTRHCASCHGGNLEGQPNWRQRRLDGRLPAPPHDETGHTWHHPDAHLFAITKHGIKPPLAPEGYESDMRAFNDVLSDEEIWAVLSYIKSTWPPGIRQRQEQIDQQAEQ